MLLTLYGYVIRMIDSPLGATGSGARTIEDANGNKVIRSNGKSRLDAVAVVEIYAPVFTIGGGGVFVEVFKDLAL